MSNPRRYPTFICWDVSACPPPKDVDPFLIYESIRTRTARQGLYGEAQVRLYGHGLTEDELIAVDEFADDGFLIGIADDEFTKVTDMLTDMNTWLLNTGKAMNFLVITKISQHTEYLVSGLLAMEKRGSHGFLALPDWSLPAPLKGSISLYRSRSTRKVALKLNDYARGSNEIEVWRCPTLFENMEEKEEWEEEEEEEEEEVVVVVEEDGEDVPSDDEDKPSSGIFDHKLFSVNRNSSDTMITSVFWDVEDYPLPASSSLITFYENIRTSLKRKGYDGDLFIWAYVPDSLWNKYQRLAESMLLDQFHFQDKFCFLGKVRQNKYERISMMMFDLNLWAIDNPRNLWAIDNPRSGDIRVPNLLVIAKDDARTDFNSILGCFTRRGYTVFLALPSADDVAPEEAHGVIVLPWKDLRANPKMRKSTV